MTESRSAVAWLGLQLGGAGRIIREQKETFKGDNYVGYFDYGNDMDYHL